MWRILTDFDAYPEWNPFIKSVRGRPEASTKLEVRIEPPGGRSMTFKPTVLEAEPERELRWLGRVLLPGIFDGEHSLRIEPADRHVHSSSPSASTACSSRSSARRSSKRDKVSCR